MSEKNFWSYMRGILPIKMYRVENKVSKGMPDIHFVKSGNSGWIELKFVKSFEPDKKINIGLKQEQHIWLKDYKSQRGKCWILLKADTTILLFDGAEDLTKSYKREYLLMKAVWVNEGSMDEEKWNNLAIHICTDFYNL
tara:strand:- start:10321 stop:10737 length:417 start_codon:yes stop_codon:yes gene_type:complete